MHPSLLKFQTILAAQFTRIRNQQTSPIYFIEHGFGPSELEELLIAVQIALQSCTTDDARWTTCPLPLLVAATEVGYRYRGPGNDFWPVLAGELKVEIGGIQRLRFRDLFVNAAQTYRGATPPLGPWSSAFHIIAWPITHALLPVEFHRPMAVALANIRQRVAAMDDSMLYSTIRAVVGRTTTRFETFLQDPALVVAVARSLLQGEVRSFSPEIVARISADISRDATARTDLALARAAQRSAMAKGVKSSVTGNVESIPGKLQLSRANSTLTLEAVLPQLEVDLTERLRRELRKHRYAPSLWGITTRLPAEQLLSGLPFPLRIARLPEPDAKLLPDLATADLQDDLRTALARYVLTVTSPSVFVVESDGLTALQVLGSDIPGHRRFWVLYEEQRDAALTRFPQLGRVGPLACAELDPTNEAAAKSLRFLGFNIRFGTSVTIAGAPSLNNNSVTPEFAIGDWRVLVPRRDHGPGARIRLDGEEAELTDSLIRFQVAQGLNCLEVVGDGYVKKYNFKGVEMRERTSPPLCWIELLMAEPTVQALLGGKCALRIDSLMPMEGLDVRIELQTLNRTFGITYPIGQLPQLVPADADLWSSLIDESVREVLLHDSGPTLRVSVGHIASKIFQLEQRVQSCWWRLSDSSIALQSELGQLSYGTVGANAPAMMPATSLTERSEVRLLTPINVDSSIYGADVEFYGLCVAPNKIQLELEQPSKPRLERRRFGIHGGVGLEDLVEAYFRWALADCESIVAELRRKQVLSILDSWVVELCCGEEWVCRELQATKISSDQWQMLLVQCMHSELGKDPYVALSKADAETVSRLSVSEIRRVCPEMWVRLDELSSEDYEKFDLACARAYGNLATQYEARGDINRAAAIAEGDPGTPDDSWMRVLRNIRDSCSLKGLGELLLPTKEANHLVQLDYSLMSLMDLTDELIRWTRDARRSFAGTPPSDEALKTILDIWLAPGEAVRANWRGVMSTLLAERCISRPARYMVLRWRQARQQGLA